MMLKNKFTSMILVIILMLQSCTVYQKTEVTLDGAKVASSNKKTLITKTDGAKLKIKRIEQINGTSYGITKVKATTE
jgi:hypothetical protein